MKFKSLFAIAATALAMVLSGCENEENPGIPELTITPTELNFASIATESQTVTLIATREWSVVSCPDWVGLSVEKGPASTSKQQITVSVEDNVGANNDAYTRDGVIVFYNLAGKKSVTITQEGPKGVLDNGSGTKDKPYTVAGVKAYIDGLDNPSNASPEKVYISGKVSAIGEQYGTQFGNGTFYISTDGTSTSTHENEFYVYRALYLGGQKFKSGDTEIKVGDDVVVYGNVYLYGTSNPVYETVTGEAYLYSLNGVTGGDAPTPTPGTAKGTGTLADPYNPAGAAAAVASLTWTSNTDYQKTDPVYVKGKISKIADNGTYTDGGTYGNASFYITDSDDATGEFYVFRALYLGNKKFASGQTDIKVGDEVVICGALMNYHGNTPETVSGEAYLYSLNGVTGGDAPTPTPSDPSGTGTLADPYNAAGVLAYIATLNGAEESPADVYIKGKISSIKYTFSAQYGTATFDISDDGTTSGSQFTCYSVYTLGNQPWVEGNTQVKTGDEVVICGKVYNYNSNTPETVSKKAYIYSLNGNTSDTVSDLFGVENAALSVGAAATFATIKVTGNVAWTAVSTDATVTPASGTGAGDVVVSFAANTDTENAKTYHVTLSTTADVAEKTINVVITQGKAGAASGENIVLTFPDDNKANNKVNGYTDNWTAKSGSYSWTMVGFNNYEWNNWSYIRCGRKNNASVASITTDAAIGFAITSVKVTYDKFGNVNSHKLLVCPNSSFEGTGLQEITGTATSAGEAVYAVPTSAAGMYYKLVIDNKSASSNGSVQISKIIYSVE